MEKSNIEGLIKKVAIYSLEFFAFGLNINTARNQYKEFLCSQGLLDEDILSAIESKRVWYKDKMSIVGLICASIGYAIRSIINDVAIN